MIRQNLNAPSYGAFSSCRVRRPPPNPRLPRCAAAVAATHKAIATATKIFRRSRIPILRVTSDSVYLSVSNCQFLAVYVTGTGSSSELLPESLGVPTYAKLNRSIPARSRVVLSDLAV